MRFSVGEEAKINAAQNKRREVTLATNTILNLETNTLQVEQQVRLSRHKTMQC